MDENVMVTRTLPIRRSPRNEELIHERVDVPAVEKLCVHELGEAVADPPPHPLTAGPDRVQIRVGREIVGIEAQGWGLYRVFVVGQVYEVRENPVTVLGGMRLDDGDRVRIRLVRPDTGIRCHRQNCALTPHILDVFGLYAVHRYCPTAHTRSAGP